MAKFSEKISLAELKKRMAQVREEALNRIELHEIELSNDPAEIAKRRAIVFKGDEAAFRFFCKTYLPHHFPDDTESLFHSWAYKTLPEITREKDGVSQSVAAPRGEAKTTLVVQANSLFNEVRNVKHNTVVISKTEEQADEIIETIKTELTDNPMLRLDFPEACGQGVRWRIGEILTRQGNKFKAYGSEQEIRGAKKQNQRPDTVYLDDLEGKEQVNNPKLRDKLERWIATDVQPLGQAGSKIDIIYVGTILCKDSVLARIMKNPFWRSVLFSAIVKYPERMDLWEEWENIYRNTPKHNQQNEKAAQAFYLQNEAEMLRGSKVSWSKRPLLTLMKIRARDGLATFQCEYQNEPSDPESEIFAGCIDQSYYRTLPHDVIFYGSVDPSLGKKAKTGKGKGGDPSAILVGAYQRSTGILYVVEARIKHRTPNKIIQETIKMQKEYGCHLWAIEAVQFQAFFKDELVKESGRQGTHVPAKGVTSSTDKELRIESIQPHMENGFIKLLPEQRELINQLRFFPNHDHDDGPDALHMLWMLCQSGQSSSKARVIDLPPPILH